MTSFALIRHKVKDFKSWKAVYDADKPRRAEAGLTEKQIFHSADNPNEVVILFEAKDLQRAKAMTSSEDLRHKMQEGGVVDKPDFYFLNS